ncbi:hypothetical protein OCC_13855 [Thermococcus litoralis DSM 5473]|uniref:Glycosyl transferase family 1 domain-containing protein n=1 Tax=Thermococcus litoralis (strain ATCC 51850 / DSM 5473 / JCM 8560 / NS-C) TaxID=523849 RepID=S5Z4Q8_THELN|nr:glycosyltransferase [Thermococcus litoralis]AGT34255.1 hypothetical protein OCC_13855 [Thermococcus litoralis DSM 5473]
MEDDAYKLPRFNLDDNIGKYHPYILFIGRISPVKNIEEIIKYVSKLKEVNLIIAGPIQDKVYFNRLHAISRQLNVDGRIKYIGEVLGEHKYKLIDNSIAVILLSKQEADPIVVKEAITRGKPVLINKLLQLSFFKKSMECIFVINDVSTFRKLLIDILTNQKKYLKSGHRCRIKAKEWKWETVAKRTFKVYKTSLGGKVKWKPKNIRSGYSR